METFYGDVRKGFSSTRIIEGGLQLKFLGAAPKIFRPGMPFEAQVLFLYKVVVANEQQFCELSSGVR